MKFNKNLLYNVLLAFLAASLIALFCGQGLQERLEAAGLDFLFRVRGSNLHDSRIVIVGIDDANIAKIGRWPWTRDWHAAVTRALKDLGAKAVYFDIIFSETSSEENDDLFSATIKEAGMVYLPFTFQERSVDEANALLPIEKFSSNIKGTGSINIYPDMDGSVRKIPLFFDANGKIFPHVALKIAMDSMGMGIERVDSDRLIISNAWKKIEIPLVDENKMIVNWMGKWRHTFSQFSFLDVLDAYKKVISGEKPGIDTDEFKGSICLVAVTAIGLHDIKPIALEPEYPGVGILATAISNILEKNFVIKFPVWAGWFSIYVLVLIPFLFVSGDRPLRGILSVASAGAVFFMGVLLLFKQNMWLDPALPLLSLLVSYSGVAAFRFVRVSMERQHFLKLAVTDELTGLSNIRYFMMVLKSECLLMQSEKSRKKRFCVVMADIDHFKHFNDTYGHAVGDIVLRETADILKSSVRGSDVVARYGGEEMIILLRDITLDDGLATAEKIRKNVERHAVKGENGETYSATISLGVASFNLDDDEKSVVKRTDDGLYKAKNSGRNRVDTVER